MHHTTDSTPARGFDTALSSRTHVLIVEDELDIAELIKHTLEKNGDIDARIVDSGDGALKAVAEHTPDLIILDLNLPVLNGIEVCRILRARSNTAHVPIIILTARASESDRVTGLDVGADDYITKPFSLRELAARVRAVLRRGRPESPAETRPRIYRGTHLTADFDAISVSVDGTPIRLTRREYELLGTSWRIATASCRAIDCSSASGATIDRSRLAPWTCTSDACEASSGRPGARSKRSSAWATDSWSNSLRPSRHPRATPPRGQTPGGRALLCASRCIARAG